VVSPNTIVDERRKIKDERREMRDERRKFNKRKPSFIPLAIGACFISSELLA